MHFTTILGLVAGALTTIAFVPQVLKSWRTRSTEAISLPMFVLFSSGVALWTAYGVIERSTPIIAANAVTLVLAAAILVMKVKFK